MKIEEFSPRPYFIDKHGNSIRDTKSLKVPKNFKKFHGVYAGPDLYMIAPYFLMGKHGHTDEIPWIAVYRPRKKPILHIHQEDFEKKHPDVYISRFSKSDFKPRKDIVKDLFGKKSMDFGLDEYISTKKVTPISQERVEDIKSLVKKYMDVKIIPSKNGKKDKNKLKDIEESLKDKKGNFKMGVIVNGSDK